MSNKPKKLKLKWKIADKPTGRYAGFEKRGWPSAEFEDGRTAVQITCKSDYCIKSAKSGNHDELSVRVADYSVTPWKWRLMTQTFATLESAKAGAVELFNKRPEFLPKPI